MVYAYPKSVRIQSSTSWEWIWQGTPSWQMTAWVKIAVVAWFKLRIVQHNRSWGYRIQSPALSMTTYGSRRLLEGIEYGDSVRCIYCVYINPAVNYRGTVRVLSGLQVFWPDASVCVFTYIYICVCLYLKITDIMCVAHLLPQTTLWFFRHAVTESAGHPTRPPKAVSHRSPAAWGMMKIVQRWGVNDDVNTHIHSISFMKYYGYIYKMD